MYVPGFSAGAGLLAASLVAIVPEYIPYLWLYSEIRKGLLSFAFCSPAARCDQPSLLPHTAGQVQPFLFPHALFTGRSLYIPHQLSPFLCTHVNAHKWDIYPSGALWLLYCLLPEHHFLGEDFLCVFASHSVTRDMATFIVFAPCQRYAFVDYHVASSKPSNSKFFSQVSTRWQLCPFHCGSSLHADPGWGVSTY